MPQACKGEEIQSWSRTAACAQACDFVPLICKGKKEIPKFSLSGKTPRDLGWSHICHMPWESPAGFACCVFPHDQLAALGYVGCWGMDEQGRDFFFSSLQWVKCSSSVDQVKIVSHLMKLSLKTSCFLWALKQLDTLLSKSKTAPEILKRFCFIGLYFL